MKRKRNDEGDSKVSSWQGFLIDFIENNQLLETGEQTYNTRANENSNFNYLEPLGKIFENHATSEPISKIKNEIELLQKKQKSYQRKELIYYCTRSKHPLFLIDYLWLFHSNNIMLLRYFLLSFEYTSFLLFFLFVILIIGNFQILQSLNVYYSAFL